MAITVLHVIDTLGYGGAERFLVGLVRFLDRERFRPLVAWLTAAGPFTQVLEEAGIPVVGVQAKGHRDARALIRLRRIMRAERVDIVHTHLFVDGFYGRLAALMAGVPVRVVTQQNAYEDPRLRLPGWQIQANRLLARVTHHFVAVSTATRDYLHRVEGVPLSRISVVPNAVAPPPPLDRTAVQGIRQQWAPTGERLVGTIARLEPQKGLDILVEAMAIVRRSVPNVRCIIVGQGELRPTLEAHIRRLNLGEHVRLVGLRGDVWHVLGALDVFVLPSRFEGLSLALLEAMAVGTPVVATAVSGTVEVVQDGVTGRLVPPEDPDTLAQALVDMLRYRETARRLGEAGRRLVLERYTLPRIAREYETLYLSLLSRHARCNSLKNSVNRRS